MAEITINLNDKVRFKLTELGREIYYHQFDDLIKLGAQLTPERPKEDAEGYASMQLWEFLELYGPHIGMARKNVIEPLNLIAEIPDQALSAAPQKEKPATRILQRVECIIGAQESMRKKLNGLLADGWRVVTTIPIQGFAADGTSYRSYTEYLLEREEAI